MALFKSIPSTFARSSTPHEAEVQLLRLKLQQAEETIRSLQSHVIDSSAHRLIENSLRQSEKKLEAELADTKLLQSISSYLIQEENVDALYTKIVEVAMTIMQSDFSSMQMYYPDKGMAGELQLLASSGFTQEGKNFWAWVGVNAGTTCAMALKTGKRFMTADIQNCEHVVGTPDHAAFIAAGVKSAQTTPLFSRSGKLLGMISTHYRRHHTPTERDLNLLDILARQAADLIERNIATKELQETQIALVQANQCKDEFLATLAHELRNPLSPISNALQIMRAAPMGQRTPELISMMDRQVTHMVRLVDDLLDVSRLSQGKIDLRREKISLQSAVLDAVEASRPLIESSAHEFVLNLPAQPVWIDADVTRIAQVVSNLLNNAAKYTPPQGRITLSVTSENGEALLSVADTGVGIPADMLPKVFDLFTQVDRNLDRAQGGLGIGLSLVQQLLALHNGSITAKSDGVNQGSVFSVRLPLAVSAESAVPASVETLSADKETAQGLRVLVVDDNISSAQTVGWLLELDNHEIKLAHSSTEALATADDFMPDAILLDIGLPGMNGYDLCRELRKDSRFKNTLMVAQTGWGQARDRELAQEAGFDHHLVKPLDFKKLSTLLLSAVIKPLSKAG